MHKATIVSLKALIVAMIVLLLACQLFMVPGVARQSAETYADLGYLQTPGIIVAVLFLLCVQVVLVCVWRLLSMVRTSVIFSDNAFLWVDVILCAMVLATLLIGVSMATLASANVASPSVMLLCALGVVVGAGLALLILVLRGLLRNARQLQQDLSEVV
ncbi:DUF2975 domain-containing protein [Cryobacterium sp. TMT1-62]|uniref:DUF2975 domain-containing protein n=1 Tax=Cryobacterium sandaracinum TaxID=1259247 RepID=A0ABY2J4L7_9MICO|nr:MULTISPECIES: DUF2975 domain-containing protein [Cryobacterium]TFB58570.1 DUF2975 domain-containing protein [Cryobacterium sp. Sr3]TFB63591.1 DUF2975 domain-containing protein [Cryobacterium sp. Hz7]TFC39085.1 DUF2975 domain-containing protein [Cryobacterium sp. TMT2-14]TFC50224.1 DUF2975 domain-containing protein [Cryobacterium sp. TMT2-17-1]TFC99887.1 DUF2975 domain-containing protein [Cryobacterium sandaracinum]